MNTMTIIYLAEVFDNLKLVMEYVIRFNLAFLFIGSIIVPLIIYDNICGYDTNVARGEKLKQIFVKIKKPILFFSTFFITCIFLQIFIPSSKTVYMMVATKVGADIVKSPETKEISEKVLKLVNKKLDDALEEKK